MQQDAYPHSNRVTDPPRSQEEADALRAAIAARRNRLAGLEDVPLIQRIALAQDEARLAAWDSDRGEH